MVDAVLFEWDGVLADTAGARRAALSRALAEERVHIDDAAIDAQIDGRRVEEIVAALLTSAGRFDLTLVDLVTLRAWRAFSERMSTGITLRPGARELVERAQCAAPLAIVTSASRSETELVLRLADLEGAFTTVVAADDGHDAPPSAAMYRHAVEHLRRRRRIQDDHVIALACGVLPLRAARAAGVHTVAVATAAHVSVEADGAVDSITGLTVRSLAELAGVEPAKSERWS